jgi:hypothetical protein
MADNEEQALVEILPLEGGYEKIELRGGALPLQGVEFGGEQRMKTTFYVGNPTGSQTFGGPVAIPSIMSGRWTDVELGDGNARALVLRFEELRDKAIPVEVRWGGRSFANGEDPAIVRRGAIKKFTPKYKRAQYVEWTCEFEWKGTGQQTKAPTFSASFSPSQDFSALQETLEKTQDQTKSWTEVAWRDLSYGTGAMLTVSDALDKMQNAIVDCINVVDGATGMLQDANELPSQIADRVQGVSDRVVLACMNGRAAFDSVCGLWPGLEGVFTGAEFLDKAHFFQQQAKAARLAMYPSDDPLDYLDGQTAQCDLIRSWDLLAEQAAVASAQLASRQVPDIIAVIRPAAGTDLRDIAAKPEYYGDPDLWILIADYNNLPTSEVPAGPMGASDDGAPPIYIPRQTDYVTAMQQIWGSAT